MASSFRRKIILNLLKTYNKETAINNSKSAIDIGSFRCTLLTGDDTKSTIEGNAGCSVFSNFIENCGKQEY